MSAYDIDTFDHPPPTRRSAEKISKAHGHLQTTTHTTSTITTNNPTTTPTTTTTTTLNEHATFRRQYLQEKLGSELEQLTRRYAERLHAQHLLEAMPLLPTTAESTDPRQTTPEQTRKLRSDFFEAQIMKVEPYMLGFENSKTKGKKPITDLLLRILLISHEAVNAELGWDDVKMNKVARRRLRDILDFEQPDPTIAGFVYDLEQTLPLSAPLHKTVEYFTHLEYDKETDPTKPALEKYFAKIHGVTAAQPKSYAFEYKPDGPKMMEIGDILGTAASGLRSNLKKRIRRHEQKFIKANIHTGDDLYQMCWKKFRRQEENDQDKDEEMGEGKKEENTTGEWQLEDIDDDDTKDNTATILPIKDPNEHDEDNGEPIVQHLLEPPFNMHEQDLWRILAVIGIRNPEIVERERQGTATKLLLQDAIADAADKQARLAAAETKAMVESMGDEYADPKDMERVQRKREEAKQEHRDKIKAKRRALKKEKKKAAKLLAARGNGNDNNDNNGDDEQGDGQGIKKKPVQKLSRRKKMRMLKALRDRERAVEKEKEEAEYNAAHANSEGIEFKKRAYRPTKAAIMMNARNFYDDARLSTRRPGSRNSVFEPSLEDTVYGRAKIQNGEMKRRGTEYVFQQPKGHLKALARFNLTLVRPPTIEQKRRLYDKRKQERIDNELTNTTTLANNNKNNKNTIRKRTPGTTRNRRNSNTPGTSPIKANRHRRKRPQSTDYTPIPLHTKTTLEMKNQRLKEQRFGSLRNLDRAVMQSKQMLHEIRAIPTTANTMNNEYAGSSYEYGYGMSTSPIKTMPRKTLADVMEMNSQDNNNDQFAAVPTGLMNGNMAALVLEDLEEMDGVVEGVPVPAAGIDNGCIDEEGAEYPNVLYDDDGVPMYLDEDGDYYYEGQGEGEGDDDDWYDSGDDETVQQLKDLQRQYEQKLIENSKGKSIRANSKVPVLPLGFVNGQIRLTRTAQKKYIVQEVSMKKLDKQAKKHGKKLRDQVESAIRKKKQRPKPPYWLEQILNLTKRKKKTKKTQKQLIAELRGDKVVKVGEAKGASKTKKGKMEGGDDGDDSKKTKAGEGDDAVVVVVDGEGAGEKIEDKAENEGEDKKEAGDEATKGVENVKADATADTEQEEEGNDEDDYDPMAEFNRLHGDQAPDTEHDRIARETLRDFNRYVLLCKDKYKVIEGNAPTHATNFNDVFTEWRARNLHHRKYFGWDDPPPAAKPRKRLRPLGHFAKKRQEREERRKREGFNLSAEGFIETDQQRFDRKRAERLANQPKSIWRKMYEFLI
jgi:hypothetical protein